MKKSIAVFLFFVSASLVAQNKTLTMKDVVFGYYLGLYPSHLTQLNWIPGTNDQYYIQVVNGTETLVTVHGGSTKTTSVISLPELNDLLRHHEEVSQETFPAIEWNNSTSFSFEFQTWWRYTYDLKTKLLTKKVTFFHSQDLNAENIDEAPASKNIAYTTGNDLVVLKYVEGSPYISLPVTYGSDEGIVNGKSVHREEFGISKGTFWSPTGNVLAFYRMDQTMVTDYPIYDLTQQPATVRMIKYPMAGQTSHQVTIGIFNVSANKTIFLKTGEPKEQYLTNIAWSPDEKHVYVQILNRDQNHLWLNSYNAATGDFEKTLFEETSDKYVHPMHPMQFVPGHPDQFIWQSQTISTDNPEGLNHLYLYNVEGKLLAKLTETVDIPVLKTKVGTEVLETYGFDKGGKMFFFQGAPIGTCERQIYSVSLDPKNPQVKKLTSTPGNHGAQFSSDKKYFIDNYSSPSVPSTSWTCDASNGKQICTLNVAKNPLSDYKKCNVKLFTITAADGSTPLWCRMILPADFDSTKQYRTLTYVYNGPNVQLVTNSWLAGSDLFLYYMAQQGFVVFTVDGRGSGNRGLQFEQATFRHLGTQEIADQQKGNDYLRTLKYVDSKRMAVYGWSFGGFMTTSLMTRTPDNYKCGVAGGAVIDWSYYEVMYTERYMDTPKTNPEGYKESDLKNYAQNLKGKLLMIHGTSDDVVVWQHTLLYTKVCVDKGVQTDYYMYPGHEHNVRGKDRMHLLTKVSEYIISNT